MWPQRRERSEPQAPVPFPGRRPASSPAQAPPAQAPSHSQGPAQAQTKTPPPHHQAPRRLRSACDSCHHAKMRCSGGVPCSSCADSKQQCIYSVANRIGRPKGTKNKKTLSQLSQIQAQRHMSTQTESRRTSTELRSVRPATMAVDMPQRALPASRSNFEPLVDSASNATQSVSYSLASSDPSCWDSITYEFVGDVLDEEGKGAETVALSIGSTAEGSRRCASDRMSTFDGMTVDSASGDPSQLPYTLSTSDSSCWNSINYDFGGEMTLDGGNPFNITRPPSEESPHNPPDIVPPMPTPADTTLQWNDASSPGHPNNERRSPQHTEPRPGSPSTCSCLQDHAELLYRLKDLDRRHTPPSIDTILVGTKQALEPWKRLIKCRICRRNDDQEVLLIAAMTMRTVLQRFLGLYSTRGNRRGGAGDPGPRRLRVELPEDDVKFTVGIYQVVGQEQVLVIDMLLWNTLRRIKCALACLRERLDYSQMRRRIAAPTLGIQPQSNHGGSELDFEPSTDAGHLQQMMHSFEAKVRVLENILKENERLAKDLG